MNEDLYNQTGNYTALAGVVVILLSKVGVSTNVQTIITVIGGVVALVGIVKQYLDHKKLAVASGATR